MMEHEKHRTPNSNFSISITFFFCGFLYFRGFGGILFVMSSSDDQTHEASGGLFGGLYMCVFGLS
jgi:hypothetical protein